MQKSADRKVQNLPRVSLAGVRDMLSDEEWFEMRNKDRRGIAISQVAREQGVNWRTAKKYMNSSGPPKYKGRNFSESKRDPLTSIQYPEREYPILSMLGPLPYKDYIKELLDQHPFTSKRISDPSRTKLLDPTFTFEDLDPSIMIRIQP